MSNKSILVDVDETTSALIKSINSDLTTDVTIGVEDILKRFKTQINTLLVELKEQVSKNQQEVRSDNKRFVQLVQDLLDKIEDIEDILENLDNLDNIGEAATKLGNAINTLSEGFSSIKEEVNRIGNRLSTDLNQKISSAEDNLKASLNDLLNKSSRESAEILKYTNDGLSETKNARKEILQATAKIEANIITIVNENLSRIEQNLKGQISSLKSQINTITSRLDNIESIIKQSNESLSLELENKTEELSSKLDSIISLIKQSDNHSMERDNNILSILERTLYQVTPFWKRTKLKESEK